MAASSALRRACAAVCTLFLLGGLLSLPLQCTAETTDVRVEITRAAPSNALVTRDHAYDSMVTLSIEQPDGSLVPSGWSTRAEEGFVRAPCMRAPCMRAHQCICGHFVGGVCHCAVRCVLWHARTSRTRSESSCALLQYLARQRFDRRAQRDRDRDPISTGCYRSSLGCSASARRRPLTHSLPRSLTHSLTGRHWLLTDPHGRQWQRASVQLHAGQGLD